jgi:outer membrane receptor protein involved in Fe transport
MSSFKKAKPLTFLTSCLIALMIVSFSCLNVMAQATTGSLRGTVTDANGAVVAGATVSVKNEATGSVSPDATTSGEGSFDVTQLQPGTYTVTVEATGFKRSVTTGVPVKIGIVNPFTVALEAGNVAETVTVTAGTEEIVQRDQAQLSTTVNTRQVADLPSNGAGFGLDTLALLAPGVINQRSTGANTNGTGLSVNGNRGRSNNFQIDGADNNDLSVTGPALFVDFQDQVAEYQVITNNFSAQYGRNQGAVINIVTKGGTNTFHGSAFWYHQDNKNLNSLNNIEKRSGQLEPNASLYNVFGGTIGGPLFLPKFGEGGKSYINGKNKYFFFFGYQGIRNPSLTTNSTSSLAVVGSELARLQSTFPASNAIRVYANNSPFAVTLGAPALPSTFASGTPGLASVNTNPASGCPRAILTSSAPPAGCTGYAPTTFLIGGPYDIVNFGTATAPQLFQAAQYQRTVSTAFNEDYYNIRFDARITDQDNVTVRYLKQTAASENALMTTTSGWNGDVPSGSKHFGGSWTRTWGSNLVTEFRPNYQKIAVEFGGGCTNGIPGCIPGPTEIATAFTNLSFTGNTPGLSKGNVLGGFGPATNLPQGRIGEVWQYPVHVTWSRGNHSWIFGGEFKHLKEVTPFLPNFNGAFGFNSVARLVNNAPSAVSITLGDPTLAFTENDHYYYAQDDWKVKPNLTLNLGVRYENTGQPINVLNDVTVERESNPATAFFNPALPLAIRTVPRVPTDNNNFAPRVGFAWSPKFWKSFLGEDATVIRGGYSIAYDAAFYNILLNVQNAAPFSAALTIPSASLPATGSPAPIPANPTGDVVRAAAAASGVLPKGVLNPIFLTQTTVAPDFRAPYAEQWSLGVQHQFGRRHVAEVRYVGTHGVGLFQSINDNFFVGPLVNGVPPLTVCTARNSAGTCTATSVVTFPSFSSLLPAGTTAQVCTDVAGTPDNESACNNRLKRQAGLTTRANTSQSIYHGLQSRYNGRFFRDSVNLGLAYSWSKAIDDASDIFARTDITSPNAQNPFCVNRCERATSAVDRPHAFSANFIWDIPYMKEQRGVVGHLLGGWQINGTYFLTSGATFTPSQSTAYNSVLGAGYLTSGDRPFLTCASCDRRLVGISQVDAFNLGFINTVTDINGFLSYNALNAPTRSIVPVTPSQVKYILNAPGSARLFGSPFGSAGRNIERGPAFNQLNMGLFKNIRTWERVIVQLRAEAFNVLNHPTPGIGNTVGGGYLPAINVSDAGVSNAAFGEEGDITYARRVVQVGLRIAF